MKYIDLLEAVAVSNVIYREQGFISSYEHNLLTIYEDARISNSEYINMHFDGRRKVDITSDDFAEAEKIVEYWSGLAYKKIQRNLTVFEERILTSIVEGRISEERVGLTASLPHICKENRDQDEWDDIEEAHKDTSEFLGDPGDNIAIEFDCILTRPNMKGSNFCAGLVNRDIVKFHTYKKIEKGKTYQIQGHIKNLANARHNSACCTFIYPTRIQRK